MCLVDLGHHLPNTNIEMVVSRLIDVNKLGGFHFNDSKFGDDDLDAGSINPYELFLIFNELTAASQNNKIKNLAYMIDQSHNVTDPIESLISSANEIVNSYTKSLLVDYSLLEKSQDSNDAIQSMQILKTAYNTDVNPIVAMARFENGNSIDPINTYRTTPKAPKARRACSWVGLLAFSSSDATLAPLGVGAKVVVLTSQCWDESLKTRVAERLASELKPGALVVDSGIVTGALTSIVKPGISSSRKATKPCVL